jgi:hypothetical protein
MSPDLARCVKNAVATEKRLQATRTADLPRDPGTTARQLKVIDAWKAARTALAAAIREDARP